MSGHVKRGLRHEKRYGVPDSHSQIGVGLEPGQSKTGIHVSHQQSEGQAEAPTRFRGEAVMAPLFHVGGRKTASIGGACEPVAEVFSPDACRPINAGGGMTRFPQVSLIYGRLTLSLNLPG